MLTVTHTDNVFGQSLSAQASSLLYRIDTTINSPYKYPLRPLTPNQINNISDANLRKSEIQFILNVKDSLATPFGQLGLNDVLSYNNKSNYQIELGRKTIGLNPYTSVQLLINPTDSSGGIFLSDTTSNSQLIIKTHNNLPSTISSQSLGMRIASGSSQKLSFFGTTNPVIQQNGDIGTALINYGLMSSITYPFDTNKVTIDRALLNGNSSKRTYFFGLDKNSDLGVQLSTGAAELYLQDSNNSSRYFWVTKIGGYWMSELHYDNNFTTMKAQHGFGFWEVHDSDQEFIGEKFQHLRPDIKYQLNIGAGSANNTLAWGIPDSAKQTINTLPTHHGIGGYIFTSPDTLGSAATDGSNLITKFSLSFGTHIISTPTTGGVVNLLNNKYNIINPSGTIATLTVNFPSSPINDDVVFIKYTQAVTTVTYSNGTVIDGITSPIAGGLLMYKYDSGTTSWY